MLFNFLAILAAVSVVSANFRPYSDEYVENITVRGINGTHNANCSVVTANVVSDGCLIKPDANGRAMVLINPLNVRLNGGLSATGYCKGAHDEVPTYASACGVFALDSLGFMTFTSDVEFCYAVSLADTVGGCVRLEGKANVTSFNSNFTNDATLLQTGSVGALALVASAFMFVS